MSVLNHNQFAGASGPVQFVGADRSGIINVEQYVGNGTRQIGQYIPDRNESERLTIIDHQVRWLTGSVPSDGRPRKWGDLLYVNRIRLYFQESS